MTTDGHPDRVMRIPLIRDTFPLQFDKLEMNFGRANALLC
jgi:hypothetical protein